MDHIQLIRTTRILRAISHMELAPVKKDAVTLRFEFNEMQLPADLLPPQNHLRQLTGAIAAIVYRETGQAGAVEWDIGMGSPQLSLSFTDDEAPLVREAWPRINDAIANLRDQHFRN